jgi:hypothetical protein
MKENAKNPEENKAKAGKSKVKAEEIKPKAEHKSVYWSEPEQLNKTTWLVKKFNTAGEKIGEDSFKSKQDAWSHLTTINIYIDGKLAHTSIQKQ